MRRTATILTATLTATATAVALAGPVLAKEKSGWEPVPDQPPLRVSACGTVVTIDEVVNEARERLTQTETALDIKIRGRVVLSLKADDGRSAVVDASGPADIRISGSTAHVRLRGSSLLVATDEVGRKAAAKAGLPTIAVTKGLVRIVDTWHATEERIVKTEFVKVPKHVVDGCSLLKK